MGAEFLKTIANKDPQFFKIYKSELKEFVSAWTEKEMGSAHQKAQAAASTSAAATTQNSHLTTSYPFYIAAAATNPKRGRGASNAGFILFCNRALNKGDPVMPPAATWQLARRASCHASVAQIGSQ